MLLTLILTPSFSSPILEENVVGMKNDTFACTATSSQLLTQKLCFQNSFVILQDTDFVVSCLALNLRNKIGRFGKLILFTELVLSS